MFTDMTFVICFKVFDPTASAMVYGRRPKFFKAKHSATAKGEKCGYGRTLFEIFFAYFQPGELEWHILG